MAEKTRPIYWMGADCGEENHHLVLLSGEREILVDEGAANEYTALTEVLRRAAERCGDGDRRLVVESVRSVGMLLVAVAREMGWEIWHIPPKALDRYREVEGQPRKTDPIDALLLARMALSGSRRCHPVAEITPVEAALSRWTRLRHRLVNERTRHVERIRSTMIELCPGMVKDPEMCDLDTKAFRAVLAAWPGLVGLERATLKRIKEVLRKASRGRYGEELARRLRQHAKNIRVDPLIREAIAGEMAVSAEAIEGINSRIGEIDQKLERLVTEHPKGETLQKMEGTGLVTAAMMLGEIAPMARIMSEGACATYSGVTPLSRTSGKSKKKSRLARGVNKHALHALYLSSRASLKSNPACRAYYDKKKQDFAGHPVPHIKATLALSRQRHKIIYKILTTDEVYDPSRLGGTEGTPQATAVA